MNHQDNRQLLSWTEILSVARPALDVLVQCLRHDAEAHYVSGNTKVGSLPPLDRQELLQSATHLLQLLDRCQVLLNQN